MFKITRAAARSKSTQQLKALFRTASLALAAESGTAALADAHSAMTVVQYELAFRENAP
jgi:hypothetical protein